MVTAYLVEGVGHSRLLGRRFRLNDDHRDSVDEEHHVRTDGLGAVGERVLGRDVERVSLWMLDIEQHHVALPILRGDEDGLQTTEILPSVEVAFDRALHLDQVLGDLLGAVEVDNPWVEPLKLVGQHLPQHRTGLTATKANRVIRRQVGPTDVDGVPNHRILDRSGFGRTVTLPYSSSTNVHTRFNGNSACRSSGSCPYVSASASIRSSASQRRISKNRVRASW